MPAGRFSSLTKIAGYSGFVPKKKSSGTSDVKGLNITKAGNRKLKRDLVLAASVAMRIDPQLAFIATKMLLNGKHFNKVRVAIGRKLLERAFSLLRRYVNGEKNVEYEFRDCNGEKIEKDKAKAEAEGIWRTYEMKMDKKKNRGNQSNHGSQKTP